MLTGDNKYSKINKIHPGEEKILLFERALADIDELTIIGYGFNDFHVDFRISNAMLLNKNLRVRIVDPRFGKNRLSIMLHQFNHSNRVRGARCSAPNWIDYVREEKWNSDAIKNIQENNALREEIRLKAKQHFS